MTPPWILIIEDEPFLGELIAENLRREGYQTELIPDGLQGWERLQQGGIDLLLLDLMLPGMSGLELLKKLRAIDTELPVLILSARAEDEDRIKGLSLGADDYLGKPFHLEELLLRVRVQIRRSKHIQGVQSPQEFSFGGNTVDPTTYEAMTFNSEKVPLTRKEVSLLQYLVARPGKVVSRKEILDDLWGRDAYPSPRTIDNFIARFRKLFEKDPRKPRHFHTLRGVGYRFEP